MNKKLTAALALASLVAALSVCALAEGSTASTPAEPAAVVTPIPTPSPAPTTAPEVTATPIPTPSPSPVPTPEPTGAQTVTEYRYFTNQYRYTRTRKVTYYDNVYAVNHGNYDLTPFADVVPAEYFIEDEQGYLAPAPIVLDITNAMRMRLYNGDVGEVALLYGQYCERIRDKGGRLAFTGIHEGIDFVNLPGTKLYTIMDGEVTRAGDSNGTVAVYNEFYNVTILYLHCENIQVKRGDKLMAGVYFADEGSVGSGSSYAHVEMRTGRHTTSNKYRDTAVDSDCPYALMQVVLGVVPSGEQPLTYAEYAKAMTERKAAEQAAADAAKKAADNAERLRLEAEAKAKAEREATATPAPTATPAVELVDVLPGSQDGGYGFGATPEPTPTAAPQVEATLPPA